MDASFWSVFLLGQSLLGVCWWAAREQIAHVNWAPQFFLNPFPSEVDQNYVFKKTWTTGLASSAKSSRR